VEFHLDEPPGRPSETSVAGDEGNPERLRERDERGVRGRQRPSQLPDPRCQRVVGVPDEREVGEVAPGVIGPVEAKGAGSHEPSERVEELDVEQMGRVEVTVPCDPCVEVGVHRTREQGGEDRGGVDDDHRPSRASRTALTISRSGASPARASARARTSATGGRSATRGRAARRYTVGNRRPAGARARSVRWISSGTPRIWMCVGTGEM